MSGVGAWINLRWINLGLFGLWNVLDLMDCAAAHGPFPFAFTTVLVIGLHHLFGWSAFLMLANTFILNTEEAYSVLRFTESGTGLLLSSDENSTEVDLSETFSEFLIVSSLVIGALSRVVREGLAWVLLFRFGDWWSIDLLDSLSELVKVGNGEVKPFTGVDLELPGGGSVTTSFGTVDFEDMHTTL
jgi:hypothetical protein